MAEQSNAEKIAFHEQEIERLRREAHVPVEFPKSIADPSDPTGQRHSIANDAEHEKRIRASHKKGGPVLGAASSADQKLKSQEIMDAALPQTGPEVVKVQIVDPSAELAAVSGDVDAAKAAKTAAKADKAQAKATSRKK